MDTNFLKILLIVFVISPLIGFSQWQMPSTPNSPYSVRWYQVSHDDEISTDSKDSVVSQYALYNYTGKYINWWSDIYGIFTNSTRVGIAGNSDQNYRLKIYGWDNSDSIVRFAGYGSVLNLYELRFQTNRDWEEYISSNGYELRRPSQSPIFRLNYNANPNSIFVNGTGVGILNNNARYELDISGRLYASQQVYFPGLSSSTSTDIVTFNPGGELGYYNIFQSITDSLLWRRVGTSIVSKSFATNVGIGLTNPDQKLHIKGVTDVYSKTESTGSTSVSGFIFKNDNQTWSVRVRGDISDQFEIYDNTNSTIPISVEVGSPTYSLRVNADSSTSVYDLYVLDSITAPNLPTLTNGLLLATDAYGNFGKTSYWLFTGDSLGFYLDTLSNGWGILDFSYNALSSAIVELDSTTLKTWLLNTFPTHDSIWYLDDVNGYIYQNELTNKVGIGTNTPIEILDVAGNINLSATTTDVGQLKINGVTMLHNYHEMGDNNLFLGGAGNFTLDSSFNIGIGKDVLSKLTTGTENVSVGYYSLKNSTSADANVAIGVYALEDNTTGDLNVAIGKYALNTNVGNQGSVAIGYGAMRFADSKISGTATANTAVGYEALRGSASAANNTGLFNTAIGHRALDATTSGNLNSALGANALGTLTSGSLNTAIGYGTGLTVTTTDSNTFIGAHAGANTTGSNNIMIGTRAGFHETGSNKLYIESNSTSAPLIYGEFNNNRLRVNGTFEAILDSASTDYSVYYNKSTGLFTYDSASVGGGNTDNQDLSYTASTRELAITNGTGVTLPLFDPSTTDAGLVVGGESLGETYFLNSTGAWTIPSGVGDNLGNHTATIDINLSNNDINNIDSVYSSAVYSDYVTAKLNFAALKSAYVDDSLFVGEKLTVTHGAYIWDELKINDIARHYTNSTDYIIDNSSGDITFSINKYRGIFKFLNNDITKMVDINIDTVGTLDHNLEFSLLAREYQTDLVREVDKWTINEMLNSLGGHSPEDPYASIYTDSLIINEYLSTPSITDNVTNLKFHIPTGSYDSVLVINNETIYKKILDAPISDHGALGGLTDDDHTQYALLTGRAGDVLNIDTTRINSPTINTDYLTPFHVNGFGRFWDENSSSGMLSFYTDYTYSINSNTSNKSMNIRANNVNLIWDVFTSSTPILYPAIGANGYLGDLSYPWYGLKTSKIYDSGTALKLTVPTGSYDSLLIINGETVYKKASDYLKTVPASYLEWSDTTVSSGVGIATYDDIRDFITTSSWVGSATSDLDMNGYDIDEADTVNVNVLKVADTVIVGTNFVKLYDKRVHLYTTVSEPLIVAENAGGTGGAGFRFIDAASSSDFKFKSVAAGSGGGFKIADITNTKDVLVIRNNSTTNSIYIDPDGVGIFNADPTVPLDVTGRINASEVIYGSFADSDAGTTLSVTSNPKAVDLTGSLDYNQSNGISLSDSTISFTYSGLYKVDISLTTVYGSNVDVTYGLYRSDVTLGIDISGYTLSATKRQHQISGIISINATGETPQYLELKASSGTNATLTLISMTVNIHKLN